MAKPAKEVEVVGSDNKPVRMPGGTLSVPDTEVFQRFLAAADAEVAEINPDQVAIDVIARILNAKSVDDVLSGSGVTHARDYLDRPFMLSDVTFQRSDFDTFGPAFYAVLRGADPNGEVVSITCGARNVIAQAWKLADMEALPLSVVIKQAERTTAAGYKIMWLERAPASF